MTPGTSDLVVVLPTDTVSSVGAKLRASGATTVQLLIAEANSVFQSREAFSQLAQAAAQAGRTLTVFSPDERTLSAANQAKIEIIGIDRSRGMRAVPLRSPTVGETPSSSYATRAIDRGDLEQPIDPDDADFLDTLDRLPDDRALYDRLDDPIDSDFDDDLPSVSVPSLRGAGRRAPIIEDDSEDADDEPYIPSRRSYEPAADVTPTGVRGRSVARRELAHTPPRGPAARYDQPRRRAGGVLLPAIVGGLLVLAFAGFVVLTNRPTIVVWPPQTAVKTNPITNEVIPVAAAAAPDAAIRAVPLKSSAEVTIQGRASQQLTPVGVARGSVQIINTLGNPIELPAGTTFKASGPNNQEVSFLLDAPATVPPAVSSTSLFGTSIQFGNIEVAISAQSKGSASNVGENSIAQLIVPGQPAIQNSEQIRFLNKAIQGGSEEQRYIVAQPDVAAILGSGLSQLYNAGIASLQQQQPAGTLVLDSATVFPDPKALGDPVNYAQPVITPLVGEDVDQANPVFTMTLQADFTGLAAPVNQSVTQQLETFVPNYLQSTKKLCAPNEQFGTQVDRYVWNGQQLAIEGSITCTPPGVLPDATLAKVRSAVVGQSRANADASLASLQQSGAIGGYQLPANVAAFPGFDFLIQVERAAPNKPLPQTPANGLPVLPTDAARPKATDVPRPTKATP